jgi:hypothetical protein
MLTISSIYLGVLGLGFMLAPRQIGIEAVPADAPPALIAYLRLFGGPFIGIAVLNWLTRDAEPSTTRRAIIVANAVGFACVAAMDVWGVFGGTARAVARVFLVVHVLMTAGFLAAYRDSVRGGA